MTTQNLTQTEIATTPETASNLLNSLEENDVVEFDGDEWKVVTEAADDFCAVEFRAITGNNTGTKTLKPSSGYKGSCVVTHSRGMGAHYNKIAVAE